MILRSQLVEQLIHDGALKSPKLIEAFQTIRRKDFIVPAEDDTYEDETRYLAEIDAPLPIGHGQTISQPSTVAFMLELLDLRAGQKILDIGAGSGWQAALMGFVVGAEGKVYAIERVPELAKFAKKNIERYDLFQVQVLVGDGSRGYAHYAPYDRMVIAAATRKIPPKLMDQLKVGGRLLMPIGEHEHQSLVLVTKEASNRIEKKIFPGFRFVPLVS